MCLLLYVAGPFGSSAVAHARDERMESDEAMSVASGPMNTDMPSDSTSVVLHDEPDLCGQSGSGTVEDLDCAPVQECMFLDIYMNVRYVLDIVVIIG